MNNKINSRRFVVFFVILLITAWPMMASLLFSIGGALEWLMKNEASFFPGYLLFLPPLAWLFWFKLAVGWMHDLPAHRGVVWAGCVFGFLSLLPFALRSLLITPAAIFAGYLCYWHFSARGKQS